MATPNLNSIYNYFSEVAYYKPQYRFQRDHHFQVNINISQPSNSKLIDLINKNSSVFNINIAARKVQLPNILLNMDEHDLNFTSQFGVLMTPGRNAINAEENNNLVVDFLNTEFAIHENVFLQWIKEINANKYIYPDYPFSKATVEVVYYNEKFETPTYIYKFHEVYPYWIESSKPDDRGTDLNFYRQVKFVFNWMSLKLSKIDDITK